MQLLKPEWPAPKNIKAYTTLKTSWGKYTSQHSFNGSNSLNTDPEFVSENNKLKSLLGINTDPIWVRQTHSNTVIEACDANREKNADATFTGQEKNVCAILTADCLPLLICDTQGTKVAAIHAGWRGLAAGIIENTLTALSLNPEQMLVWLGPAIGPNKFEVGQDVYEIFVSQDASAIQAFKPISANKWLANLYTLAKMRLNYQGVNNIFGGNFCTYSQEDLFFSYRRDKTQTGRLASLIWIDNG